MIELCQFIGSTVLCLAIVSLGLGVSWWLINRIYFRGKNFSLLLQFAMERKEFERWKKNYRRIK